MSVSAAMAPSTAATDDVGKQYDWHFAMLHDQPRNRAFHQAIAHSVRRSAAARGKPIKALDIGTGSGLLAILAARQPDCSRVTAYEIDRRLAAVAVSNVSRNGFTDRIQVIAQHSTAAAVRPADARASLLVHEILDSDLLGEGVLPAIRHAAVALLEPGYRAVPARAVVYAALLEHPGLPAFDRLAPVPGDPVLDPRGPLKRLLSPGSALGETAVYDVHVDDEVSLHGGRPLSAPFKALAINFESLPGPEGQKALIKVPVTATGLVHAVIFWWEAQMEADGSREIMSNTPKCFGGVGSGHWLQAACLLPVPRQAFAGEELVVEASHDDNSLMFCLRPSVESVPSSLSCMSGTVSHGSSHAAMGDASRLQTLNCRSRNLALWRAAQWVARAASRASLTATAPVIDIGDGPFLSHLVLRCLRSGSVLAVGGRPFRRLRRQATLMQISKRSKGSKPSFARSPAVICLERSQEAFELSCKWLGARGTALTPSSGSGSVPDLKATTGRRGWRAEVVCSDAPDLPSRAAGALMAEPFFSDLDGDWGEAAIGLFWSQVTALRGALTARGVICPGSASIHGELVSCADLWSQRQPLPLRSCLSDVGCFVLMRLIAVIRRFLKGTLAASWSS
ncbi:unnamed protein product [Polarella glacialis]|uniref:Protein arginine N-methyltransferase n=1 Tax=Polarella glacialis TaxID=89957 RepID=A0A813FFJ9_POLGL|nr:unnamed protein product [Polarella glacialis]